MKHEIHLLEQNLSKEIDRQRRILDALEFEREIINSGQKERFQEPIEQLTNLGLEGAQLHKEREAILEVLAKHWDVAVEILTLREIIRRAGELAPELAILHSKLKSLTEQVMDKNRKLGHLILQYRDIFNAALQMIIQAADPQNEGESQEVRPGSLLNTEG